MFGVVGGGERLGVLVVCSAGARALSYTDVVDGVSVRQGVGFVWDLFETFQNRKLLWRERCCRFVSFGLGNRG